MRHPQGRKSSAFIAIGVFIVAASAYLSFELGRYEAGYSWFVERRRVRAREAVGDERAEGIGELTRQQARVGSERDMD
jgi:hypothetical protein